MIHTGLDHTVHFSYHKGGHIYIYVARPCVVCPWSASHYTSILISASLCSPRLPFILHDACLTLYYLRHAQAYAITHLCAASTSLSKHFQSVLRTFLKGGKVREAWGASENIFRNAQETFHDRYNGEMEQRGMFAVMECWVGR